MRASLIIDGNSLQKSFSLFFSPEKPSVEEIAVKEIKEELIEPEKWLGKLGAHESVFVHVCLSVWFPSGLLNTMV